MDTRNLDYHSCFYTYESIWVEDLRATGNTSVFSFLPMVLPALVFALRMWLHVESLEAPGSLARMLCYEEQKAL